MINLANLPQADKDEIQMQKAICLARHNCKGRSPVEIRQHLAGLPKDVQARINQLMKDKK